jgi:hypothetical protein
MKCGRCSNETQRFRNCEKCRRLLNASHQRWRKRHPRRAARLNRESRQRTVDQGRCRRCCGGELFTATCCRPCYDEFMAYTNAKRPPVKRSCSRCGQQGHIANNRLCPAKWAVDRNEYALARNAA